jgi:sulfide:quinone oxidoreductase
MDNIVYITSQFAVTAALAPEDFATAAARGFRSVISNRPDNEDHGQLTARAESVLAWRSGLAFRHVPAAKTDIFGDAVVEAMEEAIRTLEGPVLAHCKTGARSAVAWAAASARCQPVDCVLAAVRKAGFDLEALREELEAQASRKRWLGSALPALDCREAAKFAALHPAA